MKKEKFLKGSQLFALARSKAGKLDVDHGKLNLEELIRVVQAKEGHEACFRRQKTCSELQCCWQLSCKAEMISR